MDQSRIAQGGEREMKRILETFDLIFFLRISIGCIFIYAGTAKLLDLLSFADSIASFQILPKELISIWAMGLPPFEIVIGLMLFFGRNLRIASFCLLAITGLFAVALLQAQVRGLEIDCGCFGSGKPSALKTLISLLRDIFLIAAAAFLYRRYLPATLNGKLNISHAP